MIIGGSNFAPNNSFVLELLDMLPVVKLIEYGREANSNIVYYEVEKSQITFTTKYPRLNHEIAHFVEMNNLDRLIKNDFGFSNNIPTVSPSAFFVSLAREVRAMAIQSILSDDCNKYNNFRPLINDKWDNQAKKHLPFGRFENENQVKEWQRDIFAKTYCRWSKDIIYEEFKIRSEFIKDWIEAK
jgi:hypothetical protein